MKKKLILILSLMLLFCLTACSMEDKKNFEYDKSVMIEMNKSIVRDYWNVNEAEADYYLTDGENYVKTAVAGFQQAQTTDNVGDFVAYNSSEDVTTFENGAKGDILCSIIAKFKNRDVRVSVSYSENKYFWVRLNEEMETLKYYATMYGYDSADDFVKYEESLSMLEWTNSEGNTIQYRTDSAQHFVTDLLIHPQSSTPVYPYVANEVEVSAIYDTGELLSKGAENMGVGMGVVFCVLVFIACIIYLLRFVPKLLGKEIKKSGAPKAPAAQKTEAAKPAAAKPPVPVLADAPRTAFTTEDVTDGELIAVITAALHAYLSEAGTDTGVAHPPAYTASNDKLVVRSIRRVS